MRRWIGFSAIATVVFVGGGLWAHAQQVPPKSPWVTPNPAQPPAQVISGADFGFRVDSYGQDGTPIGRIVVRQNGEWKEVRLPINARRLSTK